MNVPLVCPLTRASRVIVAPAGVSNDIPSSALWVIENAVTSVSLTFVTWPLGDWIWFSTWVIAAADRPPSTDTGGVEGESVTSTRMEQSRLVNAVSHVHWIDHRPPAWYS